jgi:hypothetical protein
MTRRIRVAAVAVVALVVVAGCGGNGRNNRAATTTTQRTYIIGGTFTLTGTEGEDFLQAESAGCFGYGGYDDIEAGLQVVISNEANTVIGNGALGPGEITDDGCLFRFQVRDVPVAKFYNIEVGRRGKLNYSYDQMKAASWGVSLTLG